MDIKVELLVVTSSHEFKEIRLDDVPARVRGPAPERRPAVRALIPATCRVLETKRRLNIGAAAELRIPADQLPVVIVAVAAAD